MSELSEKHWAVISERGCEASGLSYNEALELRSQLTSEKVYGLCIVTDRAARHFLREGSVADKHLKRKEDAARASARKAESSQR
jgi:hypothetical protein